MTSPGTEAEAKGGGRRSRRRKEKQGQTALKRKEEGEEKGQVEEKQRRQEEEEERQRRQEEEEEKLRRLEEEKKAAWEEKEKAARREETSEAAGGGEQEEEILRPRQATFYRRAVARLNYLAADRVDIGFAVKEVARQMAHPTERDNVMVKRLLRYLRGKPAQVNSIHGSSRPALSPRKCESPRRVVSFCAVATCSGIGAAPRLRWP